MCKIHAVWKLVRAYLKIVCFCCGEARTKTKNRHDKCYVIEQTTEETERKYKYREHNDFTWFGNEYLFHGQSDDRRYRFKNENKYKELQMRSLSLYRLQKNLF